MKLFQTKSLQDINDTIIFTTLANLETFGSKLNHWLIVQCLFLTCMGFYFPQAALPTQCHDTDFISSITSWVSANNKLLEPYKPQLYFTIFSGQEMDTYKVELMPRSLRDPMNELALLLKSWLLIQCSFHSSTLPTLLYSFGSQMFHSNLYQQNFSQAQKSCLAKQRIVEKTLSCLQKTCSSISRIQTVQLISDSFSL